MGERKVEQRLAIFMLTLFLFSIQSYILTGADPILDETNSLTINSSSQEEKISIGSFPNGAVDKMKITVPDGEVVQSVNMNIQSADLARSTIYSFTDSIDFSQSSSYYGVDVNSSSLSLLPEGLYYDFESSIFGPEWTLGGNSNWIIQSSKVISGSNTAQAGSIVDSQETSLTLDVSSLPPFSGSFEYEVSSESSYDFLIFCEDRTSCTRFSYDQRWSGQRSGTHTFTTTSTINSLTWKYAKDSVISSNDDTAWIDNVIITPDGGSGNGVGSWTSPPFGPQLSGQGESRSFGLMYMDAYLPSNSQFKWRLIDASSDTVIPGFDEFTQTTMDFGIIDWETYPLIKMQIDIAESPSGLSPIIHGIHFDGLIEDDFDTNPALNGWTITGANWSSGSNSGTGTIVSPIYSVRSGFVGVNSNSILTGSGKLEYSLDSGESWKILLNDNLELMTEPHFNIMFRVVSTGGSWAFDKMSVELIRTSVTEGLGLDIGLDGIADWSMDLTGIGRLGIQDRLSDGSLWSTMLSSPSSPSQFSIFVPKKGLDNFEFSIASPSTKLMDPYITLSHDNQEIITDSLDDLSNVTTFKFNPSQINSVNSAISQSIPDVDLNGLQFVEISVKIGSSSSSTLVHLGGIMATYNSSTNLEFSGTDELLLSINTILPNSNLINGYREVNVPVMMKSTGAITITLNSITSAPSIIPLSIELSNVTDTFTSSKHWIDVTSSFDFSSISVNNPASFVKSNSWLVELNMIGQNSESQLRCSTLALPVNGQGVNNCIESGMSLIWSDSGINGGITMSSSSSVLELHHRFKFPVEWDDEEFLTVSVNMVSDTGPMLSVSKLFGEGDLQGVENDLSLKHWSVIGPNGIPSDNEYPYLQTRRGEPVVVQAHLGFEGVDEDAYPISGHAIVKLLVNGNEYGQTSIINDGTASIPWVIPMVGQSVELEILVEPQWGQSVIYQVERKIEFGYDQVNPQLISMNIDQYDHFSANPSTALEFSISDNPILPTQANILLWNSWANDFNQNNQIEVSEVTRYRLKLPDDLTNPVGVYAFNLDTSYAPDGGFVRGWLDVADSAGNRMLDSGNLSQPLFNILIGSDGSPQLGHSDLSWEYGSLPWLHPGENITLTIPVYDKNGITDINNIELDLSANQPDSSSIFWNKETGLCTSSTIYIQINDCRIVGDSGSGLFVNTGNFEIDFQLIWGFDPDANAIRTPKVTLTDINHQSTTLELPELNWQYSGEMAINKNSLQYISSGTDESTAGSWVKPDEDIFVSGSLTWAKTQRQVTQNLDLVFTLGSNQASVDYRDGLFNGSIKSPDKPGNYPIDISLNNAPNGATIVEPYSPLLWFIVDDKIPSIKSIDYPLPAQIIEETDWDSFEILMTLEEDNFLDSNSLNLRWEIHPSGFGFVSSSIANGTGKIEILGAMPYGDSITGVFPIDIDGVVAEELRTEALELRIWISGSDMAGNSFGSVSNEVFNPFAVWQLEQQLPNYLLSKPSIIYSGELIIGKSVDLSVIIDNVGKSDGDAELRVERVESNGARTIIHNQEIKVNSGESGVFSHRWTPDRDGSMWIEFIIVGGPIGQTDTFYVDDTNTDGLVSGISEMNPVILITISLLVVALLGILIFGLRTPQQGRNQRVRLNKNYQAVNRQMKPQLNQQYAQEAATYSPGDNPYR